MKSHHKKLLISGTALTVAGILGIGALMQTSVSVQASAAMMPGIETIVNETSKEEPFRILEIVDNRNEAEIGYYVSGQEPYFKLYKFPEEVEDDFSDESGNTTVYDNITSVQDILSRLMTTEQRRDFMQNTTQNEEHPEEDITAVSDDTMTERTGIKNIRSICNPEINGPLSYIPYKETYFPNEDQADWQLVDLAKVRKVQLNGTYEKSPTGVGDYSREELAFYPIRKDTDEEKPSAKYRENIESFSYSTDGETQPYEVKFQGIDNQNVTDELIRNAYENGMGLYTNVYGYLTSTTNAEELQKFPGEDLNNPFWDTVDILEEGALQTEELNLDTEELFNDGDNFTSGDSGGVVSFSDSNSEGADAFGDPNSEAGIANLNINLYRDEEIDYFPFHRYYPVGTYSDVMDKLKTDIGDSEIVFGDDSIFDAGESEAVPESESFYIDSEGNYYWDNPADTGADQRLVYVIGRERQPYSNTQALRASEGDDTGIPYYYVVNRYELACELPDGGDSSNPEEYRYTGWYYAVNPANEERFVLAKEDETAHFYASDEEFSLTPGKGEYDFKLDESAQPMDVQVNHFYYSGGYTNHDWLKQYVFNLHPDSEDETERSQFDNFSIEVDTMTTEEFNNKYGNGEATVEEPEPIEEQQSFNDDTDFVEVNGEFQEGDVLPVKQKENSDETIGTNETGETDETVVNNEAVGDNETGENQTAYEDGSNGQESVVEPLVSEAQEELVDFKAVEDGSELLSPEEEENSVQWQDGESETDSVDMEISDSEFSDSGELFTSEEQSDSEELFTSREQSETEQSIFSAGDESVKNELDKYDLVYINGKLSIEAAQVLVQGAASKAYACIINQNKVDENEGISTAFVNYMKPDDVDQHYVTQNIYFFNNDDTDTEGNKIVPSLVNLEFNVNFNPDNTSLMEGFEEILNYIKTENQYRLVGTSGKKDSNDLFSDESYKETGTEVELSDGTKLLSTDISQARVIEYILNYKYKRNVEKKGRINVLEIQPAKSSGQMSRSDVYQWLGYENSNIPIKNATACCYNTMNDYPNTGISSLYDGDQSTFWLGAYTSSDKGQFHLNDKKSHWFTVELEKPSDVTGFTYLPRQDGKPHGKMVKFDVILKDKGGNVIYQTSSEFSYTANDEELKYCYFGEKISEVSYMTININTQLQDETNSGWASCAEIQLLDTPEVNITTMTASEYVGHIDDINAKYDMVYIGDDDTNRDELINGNKPMLYTHVGGAVIAKTNKVGLMGMLDIDYKKIEKPIEETIKVNGKWIKVKRTKQIKSTTLFNTRADKAENSGLGSFRGSGNDMTMQQYNELLDFVNSGYPVVVAGSILNTKGEINEEYIDNASYYFKFIDTVKNYPNIFSGDELKDSKNSISFFANLSKPKIEFEDGGIPPEPPRENEAENPDAGIDYLYQNDDGLKYEFTIVNDSEISVVNTTYNCQLYLDLNFDGNLSSSEEQSKYIEIRDSSGQVLYQTDKKYHLKIGEKYTLFRKIPKDYYKIITWKLQITSNSNESVRTSVMGYAKRENASTRQVIKVLQIMPDKGIQPNSDPKETSGTWNLQTNRKFQDKIKNLKDFNIQVTAVTVSNYESEPQLLDDKQMLIIGFDDVVQNISNDNKQVDKIIEFAKAGKSIIFAHDTTSNVNWDYMDTKETTENGISIKDQWIWDNNRADWGISLNKYFRPLAGLDRYGITDNSIFNEKGKITISQLLKRGVMLTDGEKVTIDKNKETVSFKKLMSMIGDVAFATGGKQATSYMQTQGYTNLMITDGINPGDNQNLVQLATKVNDGAITQYPYRMSDTIRIAKTHLQYYQLALEKDRDINNRSDGANDIVVWYCLAGNGSIYSESPNDVRNNYYFYSKGNVIYTGVGHTAVTQDQEIELFINAIVAAANVTAVQPEVQFIKSLNPAAQQESVRYYMTDQLNWNSAPDGNVLESDMEFFFNVRDYNMVSSSLSLDEQEKQDMTIEIFIEDENASPPSLDEGEVLPTELQGANMIPVNSSILSLSKYGDLDPILVDNEDEKFHVNDNSAYGFSVSQIEDYLKITDGDYASNIRIFIRVTSSVTLYGAPVKEHAWAVLDLKQRQLFDLD